MRQLNPILGLILLYIFLFQSQLAVGQDKLIDSLTRKVRTFEKRKDYSEQDTTYIELLCELARSYVYKNRDSTRVIAKKALILSKNTSFKKGLAGANLALGNAEIFDGNYTEGIKYSDKAIRLSESIKADSIYMHGLNVKAMGFFLKKDFPSTYTIYKTAIAKAKEIGFTEMELRMTMNMATTFSLIKDYEQALKFYTISLDITNSYDDPLILAQIESNLGYLYWKTNKFEKGKYYTKKAIKAFQEARFPAWESFGYITLGGIALKEEMISEAIEYYKKAMLTLEKEQDRKREADSYLGLAEAYFKKGNLELSNKYACQATKIAKSINYYEGIIEASKLLFQINKRNGMPQKAIAFLEVAQRLSDSFDLAANSERLKMMVVQNDFDNRQQELELTNYRILNRQKTISIIIVMALVTACIVAALLRKNYLDQKEANRELQKINDTKDKIFSIIGHDLKTPLNTLNELLELLRDKVMLPSEMTTLTPKIQQNIDYSTFTLNNLLFWAQGQMGQISANKKKLYIKPHVDETIFVFSTDSNRKNICITNKVDENASIEFDCEHLRIILRNLINNAIKFTPNHGTIAITSLNKNKTVTIAVCDTGIGINKNKVSQFLDSRTITTTKGTNNEKGTGLGLAICKELASMNKSELIFEPNGETGSCFSIKAPVG